MTIHSEHPFAEAAGDRSPLRRLRGRLVSPVSVWTAASGRRRAGWTVSSFLLADGEPGQVVGVVDEDSDLADLLTDARAQPTVVVNLLTWEQRQLADAFAGLAPAPGGVFRLGAWTESAWGPVLTGSAGWVGGRLVAQPPDHAGWGLLVRAVVEHVELGGPAELGGPGGAGEPADPPLLAHVRGRYRPVPSERAQPDGGGRH